MVRSMTATLACAGVFTMAVGVASAQTASSRPGAQRPSASTTTDNRRTPIASQPVDTRLFVVHAALANMAEIQLGHVAKLKAQRSDVKKFAQMAIDDHVKTQKELAEAAYGAGIKWPTQIDDQHRQLKQRLSIVKNDQFDREYMKAIIDGHRDVEKMLVEQMNGRPTDPTLAPKVNDWAASTLVSVRAHLREAEQLFGSLETQARSARR